MTYEEFNNKNSSYYRGFKITFAGFFTDNMEHEVFVHNSIGASFEDVVERAKPMIDRYLEEQQAC